jgi:hypothetical protein
LLKRYAGLEMITHLLMTSSYVDNTERVLSLGTPAQGQPQTFTLKWCHEEQHIFKSGGARLFFL